MAVFVEIGEMQELDQESHTDEATGVELVTSSANGPRNGLEHAPVQVPTERALQHGQDLILARAQAESILG